MNIAVARNFSSYLPGRIYKVSLHVNEREHAMENETVFIKLLGDDGNSSHQMVLGNSNSGTQFCDGKTDTFLSELLGHLYSVTIQHYQSSAGSVASKWFLHSIVVVDTATNESWRCPYNWWFRNDNSQKTLPCINEDGGNKI